MTKKDYIKFAQMLKREQPATLYSIDESDVTTVTWQCIVESTADIFAEDNPRFDRERFLRACGLTS